jgi:FKBP-type peptidyl-prolyl cis-trans isomerase (trigger factor)
MQKQTREELRDDLREAVVHRLQRSLVVSKLVELEDLSVEGHELTDQIDRMSMMAGERGAELREALTTPDGMRHVASDLLASKATERLVQIVKGEAENEVEIEEETEAESETEAVGETEIGAETEIKEDEEEIETIVAEADSDAEAGEDT